MNNNSINPYELLGFDSKNPNLISLEQLKKTYYTLSLICHPDKGGDPNSMIVLKNCYEYIKKQLENAKDHLTDFKTIENEFKTFLQEQSNKPPPFSAIYEETHYDKEWITKFNEQFDKEKEKQTDVLTEEVSELFKLNSNGYGHMMDMDKEENKDPEKEANDLKPTKHHFVKEITIYKEPVSHNDIIGKTFSGKIDNHTHMTDYIEAFAEDVNGAKITAPIKTNNNNGDIEDKLQKLLKERAEIDSIEQVSSIFLLSKNKSEL
jgi:curved DNA-binding protein CbpA